MDKNPDYLYKSARLVKLVVGSFLEEEDREEFEREYAKHITELPVLCSKNHVFKEVDQLFCECHAVTKEDLDLHLSKNPRPWPVSTLNDLDIGTGCTSCRKAFEVYLQLREKETANRKE